MSKYGNHKVTLDGIAFDSEKEAIRYAELKLLQRAGEISGLERQKRFELQPAFTDASGCRHKPICYVCDFFYLENGQEVIEDVKSPATADNAVYKLKKKMMLYRGYEIRET